MFVDAKTSRDLELFQTQDGSPGVFQSLDLTRTQGGSRALRARFESPMQELELIQQVHDGVRFLRDQRVEFQVDEDLIKEVESYIQSSWDVGSRAMGFRFMIQASLVSLQYKDLFQHAKEGVLATQRLISQLLPYLKGLMELDPPSEVRRPVENLLALIARLRLDDGGGSRSPWKVFSADRYLREDRKADFQRFFSLLFDLDALCAMAEALESFGLVLPEVLESEEFVLEGEEVFHPFVEGPVSNPVAISGGETLVFLTGPNMAGKTTYLKGVAVAAYLTHVGMGVPARRFRISILDAIYSSLTPEENLRAGLSFFMAEVRRVREVAEGLASGQRALVVFDEVFRGTNVSDALDASRLVIRGFARSRRSGCSAARTCSSWAPAWSTTLPKRPRLPCAAPSSRAAPKRAPST